jgi:hypothetical protein
MLRQFSNAYQLRRFYLLKQSSYTGRSKLRSNHIVAYSTAAAAAAATFLWYSTITIVHGDASPTASGRVVKARDELAMGLAGPDGTINALVWGSNECVAGLFRLRGRYMEFSGQMF